jgi:hypothetical protein
LLYQDVLAQDKYLGTKTVLSQLSDFVAYPVWEDLSRVAVTSRFWSSVPKELAQEYKMAGFCSPARLTLFGPVNEPEWVCTPDEGTGLTYLAVCEPLDPEHKNRLRELGRLTDKRLVPVLSTREQVANLIERTYASEGREG